MVFRQMLKPNDLALLHAQLDSFRRADGKKVSVKIKTVHMAVGLGMAQQLFEEAVLSIRSKISVYRMMTETEQDALARRNATIATLKQVFNVQIPPNTDEMTVRRMLTMVARDQYEEKVKGSPQITEMLLEAGAKPPHLVAGKLGCYGVLYQKNCRTCNTCDLRHACLVEATNIGLNKVTISPKLLGAKQPRIPSFLPRMSTADETRISSADESEIIAHLNETFQRLERNRMPHYFHVVGEARKRRFLFCLESTSPFKLRFCNPSDDLKTKLTGKQKTWFNKEDSMLAEIIAFIEQHARETFE